MLYLLRDATETQRAKLHKMVLKGEPMDTTILAGIADYEGAIERAIRTAVKMLNDARSALTLLPGTEYHEALDTVGEYLDALLAGCRTAG
jgi:octaprenyl-diphosphate synthase